MARRNLVLNPSFETGLGNWTPLSGYANWNREQSGVVNGQTVYPPVSSYYAYYNRNVTGDGYILSARVPIVAGQTYAASAYIHRDGSATKCAIGTEWYANATTGTQVSIPAGAVGEFYPAVSTWTRLTTLVTAPSGATYADVYVYVTAQPAYQFWRVDGVMLEPASVVGDYADGDSTGWVWDGTRGASSSSEVPVDASRPSAFFPYMGV